MVDQSVMSVSENAKTQLGWIEWLRGWSYIIYEVFFQKYSARNLQNPLPLPSLTDQTCIVTGSTSGMGLEIAKQLAQSGAYVVMAVRNPVAAHDLIQKWQKDHTRALRNKVMELDLLCLESVAKFAKSWHSLSKPFNVLINNAGIYTIGQPQKFAKNGYENHFQVNHLGPALLTTLLLPSLLKCPQSRVVNVNSTLHFIGFVDVEDMNIEKRKFTGLRAYSNSRLAQIMYSSMLQTLVPADSGLSIICVNPGSVKTNVARDLPRILQIGYHLIPFFLLDPQQGSRSALFAATDGKIVKYCAGLKADERPVCAYLSHSCEPVDVAKEAHNVHTAKIVWEKTLDMVGLPGDVVEKMLQGEDVQCRYG